MSHQIQNQQIAFSGEMPWHGIGAELEEGATPQQFLEAAKLDWELERFPLVVDYGDGELSDPVSGKFAHVRSTDRKVMAISSAAWRPLQNRDTLDFMRRYCEAGGATMETAGALRDGKIVWALARINHDFEVRSGDVTRGYILITSPHVVGQAITVRTTSVRVVCANTMAFAEREGAVQFRQNHLSDFDVSAAHQAVENAHEQLALAEARCKTLDKLKLSLDDAMRKVLVPVFQPTWDLDELKGVDLLDPANQSTRLKGIVNSLINGAGAIQDTGYGVLHGVTHYCDHVGGREPATRMYRSWMGDYSKAKLAVEKKLLELC